MFSFDKSVSHFLGWLSEMESNVDNLEFQVESSQEGLEENLPAALNEIKVSAILLQFKGVGFSSRLVGGVAH